MPRGAPTTLFVSSTCYDLAQVRADLRDFALSLGYDPVMSEFNSFPVNPSLNAVANCLRAVKNRADLFVLIVGGRYGSMAESGRSITNLEYLEARAKAVPSFVFVKRELLAVLPVWKANQDGNFAHVVDSTKVFEFVSELRDEGSTWVFPFDTAQDIVATLKSQLSYLVSESLELRTRMYPPDRVLQALGPASLRTYVERPNAWEYLVLAELMQELVLSHEAKRLDLELGISFGPAVRLRDFHEFASWVGEKLGTVQLIPRQVMKMWEVGYARAMGAPGEPANMREVVHLAQRYADAYAASIEWALEFWRVDADEQFLKALQLASEMVSQMIKQFQEFADELASKIRTAAASTAPGGNVKFMLTLTVAPETLDALQVEMNRLSVAQRGA